MSKEYHWMIKSGGDNVNLQIRWNDKEMEESTDCRQNPLGLRDGLDMGQLVFLYQPTTNARLRKNLDSCLIGMTWQNRNFSLVD